MNRPNENIATSILHASRCVRLWILRLRHQRNSNVWRGRPIRCEDVQKTTWFEWLIGHRFRNMSKSTTTSTASSASLGQNMVGRNQSTLSLLPTLLEGTHPGSSICYRSKRSCQEFLKRDVYPSRQAWRRLASQYQRHSPLTRPTFHQLQMRCISRS